MSDGARMSILEHLAELRERLLEATIAVVIGIVAGTLLTPRLMTMLVAPLGDQVPIAIAPIESPIVFFKISLIIGVVIAMPVIVHQLFMFLAPGLEPQEKRYILIGAPAAALCFAEGVVFATLVLIPAAIPFMNVFFPGIVEQRYSIDRYISFVSTVLLWSGIVFLNAVGDVFHRQAGRRHAQHVCQGPPRRHDRRGGGGSHHHPHSRPVQYASEHDTLPYPLRAGHPARPLGVTGESLPSHSYCGDTLGSDGDYARPSLGGT